MRTMVTGLLAALCVTVVHAQAVYDLDVNASAGVTAGVGGIWDYNNTVNWTADGGTTRVAWADNAAVAHLALETAYGWGSVTLSVSNNNGQVGANGLVIAGQLPDWTYTIVEGNVLQIGAGGITYASTNGNSYLKLNGPVALTASQVWRSCDARAIDGGGAFQVNGLLSSASGTTDITFDGMGRNDASLLAPTALRPGFLLGADNTYHGATTVGGGAFLWLAFTNNVSKLDASSPLVLQGGGVWMSGSAATQQVVSTVVKTGSNAIAARNGKGAFFCGSVARSGVGGVINFPVNFNGGIDAYTTSTNTSGILGGWATHNQTAFATAGTSGANTIIASLSGTTRSSPNVWGSGENVRATGGGVRTGGNVAINSLRITTDALLDLGTATVTVSSGGVLGDTATGNNLTGGSLCSGLATGELFVHAFDPCTIGSVIADNGAVPGVLVKNGSSALTLTASNTYSGATYVLGGTLTLATNAVLSGSVLQSGGTTLNLRNGGTLAPGGTNALALALNGNLTLDDGAVLALQLGGGERVSLTNCFATLTGAVSAGGVKVNLDADRRTISKGLYTLLQWDPAVSLSGFDLSDFSVNTPAGVGGQLQLGEHALVFEVTSIPAMGTLVKIL